MAIELTYYAANGSEHWLLAQDGNGAKVWLRLPDIDSVRIQASVIRATKCWGIHVDCRGQTLRAVSDDAESEGALEAPARRLLALAAR